MAKEKSVEDKINELEGTEIGPVKKETRGRKPKGESTTTTTPNSNIDDIQQKLHLIFSLPFILSRKENPYQPRDFKTEAEAIKRLMSKYEIIKKAFNIFDPIIIVIGLAQKLLAVSKPKQNTQQEGETLQNETSIT